MFLNLDHPEVPLNLHGKKGKRKKDKKKFELKNRVSEKQIKVQENKFHFILDLEQSKIVNSIGASILIEVIEILQDKDGNLSLCHMAPIIEKTFSIMGLTKYCNTFATLD